MNPMPQRRLRRKSLTAEILATTFPRSVTVCDEEFQRQVEVLIEGGFLPICELLLEVRERLGGWFNARMELYSTLDPHQLKALGADQLPKQRTAQRVQVGP